RYRSERRAAGGDRPGPYDRTLTFVVPLVADQLHVQAIHRLITDIPAGFDLPAALDAFFVREPAGPVTTDFARRVVDEAALCLVHADGTGELLRPRADAFVGVRDLDSARLVSALAAIPHEIRYQHGVDHVLAALAAGAAQWGVLLRPVTVADIEATAHERVLMPPKSTFFAPKPRTGLLFRSVA
ncbi:MAG TPA: DUF1015 domain-containing protein, partial [Acidimicrobiales bacterium]